MKTLPRTLALDPVPVLRSELSLLISWTLALDLSPGPEDYIYREGSNVTEKARIVYNYLHDSSI
jgi:hypothetical protein